MSGEREAAAASAARKWWRAAQILAGAWQPALDASFRLGYESGYQAGWIAGRDEEHESWAWIMGHHYRQTVRRPTFAELRRRRGES